MPKNESFQEQFNRLCELYAQTTQGEWSTSRIVSNTIPPSAKVVLHESHGAAFREELLAECPPSTPGNVVDTGGGFGSYPASRNADFIALAHNLMPEIQREMERLRVDGWCDACAGEGKPGSGKECMCGGSGLASDAVRYLRTELFDTETALSAKNEEVERLRSALERTLTMLKSSLAGRAVACADEGIMEAELALDPKGEQ